MNILVHRAGVILSASFAAIAVGAWRPAVRPVDCSGSSRWVALIGSHLERYPATELPNLLKLLQQATLGSEHAMRDPAEADAWLKREWAALDVGPPEPLVDTLGQGGQFARIHLRPYRAAGGAPDSLVAAFVATARRAERDTAGFACGLAVLQDLAAKRRVPWPADSVERAMRRWARDGYPALEHSAGFETRYRPAYRVVAVGMVAGLLGTPALPPALVVGDFVDDYGSGFTVTRDDWFQRPRSRYRIVAWHTAEQYLIAQNDSANRSAPGKWTRIDWVALPDQVPFQWGFCFSAFDAPTRAAAESTQAVDRLHPKTGCNGYPFSRMRRSGGTN